MPFRLVNQCCVFPHKISHSPSPSLSILKSVDLWSPAETLQKKCFVLFFLPFIFWPLQFLCSLEGRLLCTESHTPPFTRTHLLSPYSTHYPHCFADSLLSPVLAQPAMEGVEVRWRLAVGSLLAPLRIVLVVTLC